ncbi:MAG: hypothetical protein GC191_00900 [Azospirillum sp.]|nr:hypothetical protein [Azospirillum sp.]
MQLDIPLDADLEKLFALPECSLIALPNPQTRRIRLPTGGEIRPFADLSKGIPTDCSLSLNLMIQLGPLLAAMGCLFKILGLLKPLGGVIGALNPPNPIKLAQTVPDTVEALAKLADCFKIIIPGLPLAAFIIDILSLILSLIKCLIGQLKTIVGIMGGITIRLGVAEAAGNKELQRVLECAKANALASAQQSANAMEPLSGVVDLLGPILELFGKSLTLPGPGSADDIASLEKMIQDLENVVTTIQELVDFLGKFT